MPKKGRSKKISLSCLAGQARAYISGAKATIYTNMLEGKARPIL